MKFNFFAFHVTFHVNIVPIILEKNNEQDQSFGTGDSRLHWII